jgi:hypothetical protein
MMDIKELLEVYIIRGEQRIQVPYTAEFKDGRMVITFDLKDSVKLQAGDKFYIGEVHSESNPT